MAKKVNQEKLLAKIAALTGSDATELKEKADKSNLYSHDEMVFESQSVINFFKARILRRPPTRKQGETLLSFNARLLEYEAAANEWKIRDCEGCHMPFAYAYTYEGVKFCSLDCMDAELRKIGLKVTRGRDLRKRWGLFHPAIVPSSAFAELRTLYPEELKDYPTGHTTPSEYPTSPESPQPSLEPSSEMLDADVG